MAQTIHDKNKTSPYTYGAKRPWTQLTVSCNSVIYHRVTLLQLVWTLCVVSVVMIVTFLIFLVIIRVTAYEEKTRNSIRVTIVKW